MQSKNCHHPERHSKRIDKMNTKSYWFKIKRMANKKRRQLLKQNNQDKF